MENYITEVDIRDEAKDNFLTYSSEVLTDRAIPSAEDGLLSVHRKLLWTMEDYLKMNNKGKTKKSASIVGSTLATSYFHGDAACYGALCKMAQPYLMRYPLVTGQGSLGTQEANGMQASARYTEAKPSIYADIMMEDFNKKVVPLKPTYNNEFMEPVVLPALFPNAIVNGREAIGISMSHNSLPNNLTETCDAIIAYIQDKIHNVDELMNYMKGFDFPLENVIINGKAIRQAYATGKSDETIKIRGKYEIKNDEIIFNSIPYRTYRNKIREQINNNIEVFENLLSDFNDESSVGKNRLVFKVKKGIAPLRVLNKLFELTDLQTSIGVNMNFIVNGTPKMCSMIDLIEAYYKHQTDIIIASASFDKEKAEARIHILEGLIIAIKKIDDVIQTIRNSENKDKARIALIKLLNIDDIQANAILDMKLSRLTKLDGDELKNELKEKKKIVEICNKIINEKEYRDNEIIKKVKDLKSKYGDERKTEITDIKITKEEKEIANVEPEKCVVIMTANGNVKRIPAASFREQKRNTKGKKVQKDDITLETIRTNTVDNLLVFTNFGKVYKLLVDDIPVGTNTSIGTNLGALIEFADGETVEVIYSLYRETKAKYVLFATQKGLIKKVALTEFNGLRRKTGVLAIKFKEGDSLAGVSLINDEDIMLISRNGQSIKFKSDFGAASRIAQGVIGMRLAEGDFIVSVLPIRDTNDNLGIFFDGGQGKQILLSEFTTQGKGGKGIKVGKTGLKVNTALLVNNNDTLLCSGATNSICISASELPTMGRIAAGNIIIKNDAVVSVSKI